MARIGPVSGPDDDALVEPLVATGRCLIALGRAVDAIAPLERASRLTRTGDATPVLRARIYLDRARMAAGRDRAHSLDDARAARRAIAAIGSADPAELDELDGWLRAQRR